MNEALYGHCAVMDKKSSRVYLVGGKQYPPAMFTKTQVFAMTENQFTTLAGQLSVGRAGHICTILEENNLLIAAGGYTDGWSPIDTAEILDMAVGTWTNTKIMPSAGKAWTVGGALLTWTATKLYKYEPSGNEWIEIEDAPFDLTIMRNGFVPIEAGFDGICHFV